MLYLSLPLFATGCMLLPSLWEAGNPLAGLLVKCGYTVNQVLFWVLLAHKSHNNLQHTYFYFGLFYGLYELFTAGGRLAISELYSANGVTYAFVTNLALFCLWLLAMYGLVFFALMRRRDVAREGVAAVAPPLLSGEACGEAPDNGTEGGQGEVETAAGKQIETPKLVSAEPALPKLTPIDDFAARLEQFCVQYELSAREREILVETIHGYSMENIGKRLFISRETVKTHLRHIYRKAGVGGKQELLALIDSLR